MATLALLVLQTGSARAVPGTPDRDRIATPAIGTPVAKPEPSRFSNRAAASGRLEPTSRGRLSDLPLVPSEIDLTAGPTLSPIRDARAGAATPSAARPVRPDARVGYIVQFGDLSPDAARERIEQAGGGAISALPGGAYLVRMNEGARHGLESLDRAPWIRAWDPTFKLSPTIRRESSETVEVVALLFADGDLDATAGAIQALGAGAVRRSRTAQNRLVRFTLPASRIAEAAELDDVLWIEEAPHDSVFNDRAQWVVQSGIPNSRPVWDHGLRGAGQIVMVSDGGVRTNHEMFADSMQDITMFGHYPNHRKIVAYLPGSNIPDNAFGDDASGNWHGTHTCGSVAGNNDPTSTQPYDGQAKDARLWFTDLASAALGSSIHPPDDLNDLFLPSYLGNAAGAARISSNSWGAYVNTVYTLSSMQVDQFMWDHPDYLIAFANGNNGTANTVGSPATAKNCLSIGGTRNGTDLQWIYTATSRGPAKDLRRKPTVCAPAEDVVSSVGNTRYNYASYSGTSMATPTVAGAMALARQYVVDGWYPTGTPVPGNGFTPSAALLKAIAVGSAMNDVLGYQAPDNNIGWGRIDLDQALYFPGDSSHTVLIDGPGMGDREYVEYQVRVRDSSQPLRVSLCWTDAPGNPAIVKQLVNDLDLIVTNGADTYLGNRIINGTSRTGGSRDSINVEEGVRILTPAPGLWTIRVEAHRVVLGPQSFGLCATGTIGGEGGAIALDRFDYTFADTVEVEVADTDAQGPLTVTLESSTEPAGEPVTLTGTNGVFRGRLPLTADAATAHNGRLSVSSGDRITATYVDQTSALTVTTTAHVNVSAPVITNVHARALDASRALVTWTTDVLASSRVRFGTSSPLTTVVDSAGLMSQHAVLLSGLQTGTHYLYDVESTTQVGATTVDDLGGNHRSFTTRPPGQFALMLGTTEPFLFDTWSRAFDALGWDADVLVGSAIDPPLVGNSSAGLRRYAGVLWQADPNSYPPFSDAQRSAIDSLMNGGARLMVTGHDIGYALSDAGSPVYTPERETWVEQTLKARYYADDLQFSSALGVAGDPVSGAWNSGIPYYTFGYGMAGDIVIPAPNSGGTGTRLWYDNVQPPAPIGVRWESSAVQGTPGLGFWGGQPTRLISMFFEWTGLGSTSTASDPRRTGVLESSMRWLLGHRPPHVTIVSPNGGEVIAGDFLPIRWRSEPDSGRAIAGRSVTCSLDGGETWTPLSMATYSDSGAILDLAGFFGGTPLANSSRVLLRVTMTDDGTPALRGSDQTDAVFTLARPSGDHAGPVAVAGSAGLTPTPVRRGQPGTLSITFSDAETGAGSIGAAEYWIGSTAPAPGSGTPMTVTPAGSAASATAAIATANLPDGQVTLRARARDAAGNWGPATSLTVIANGEVVTAVDGDLPAIDFLRAPTPNPFRGSATVRFGLARAGDVQLDVFDLAGRRVRTLASGFQPAGTHAVTWDGRDAGGLQTAAGIYFVRLVTPAATFRARVVALR